MSGEVLLRQLEYVAAHARERHFARAAKACFVSQPALSAGIRKLEIELDVTIVQRGRRFRGVTPKGQLVVGWAHRILAERDGLRADLEEMSSGPTSTLADRHDPHCGAHHHVGL
jgi:DNA-binding transcriptional LysR family regulator